MNLEKLKEVIPCKWKPQTANEKGCLLVAYLDARQVADILDRVCGPANWQDKYEMVGTHLVCSIGIKVDGEWVFKSDTGTESDIDGEKGHFSDSFKRAAVKWGIGRFTYELPKIRTKSAKNGNKYMPADGNGEKIWDCTEYVNKWGLAEKDGKRAESPKAAQQKQYQAPPKYTPTVTLPQESMGNKSELVEPVKATEKKPQSAMGAKNESELKAQADRLGWNGKKLQGWLVEHGLKWGTMSADEAELALQTLKDMTVDEAVAA